MKNLFSNGETQLRLSLEAICLLINRLLLSARLVQALKAFKSRRRAEMVYFYTVITKDDEVIIVV